MKFAVNVRRFAVGAVLLFAVSLMWGAEPAYVGSKKCKICHLKQFTSWEQTKMAKSFELLKAGAAAEAKTKAKLDPQKDYTKDTTCLPCHTVGYGKAGGFKSIEETPELAGVGCESCHGPGSEYLKEGYMTLKNPAFKRDDLLKVGLVIPNQQTCVSQCHNEKSPFVTKGYVFNFEERKKEGTHEHIPLKHPH